MKVKVKICGIKSLEAAKVSIAAGADFLGFNFVTTSKRLINTESAKKIIDELPISVTKVGVFMDADVTEINHLIDDLRLDFVQLHGTESPRYTKLIKGAGIIKTFSLGASFDIEKTVDDMKKYNVDYYLLDRKVQGKGEQLDYTKVRKLTAIFPVILAGGLSAENAAEAIRQVKPQVVDVAGGVETNGEKDKEKIIKFIKEVKRYDI